MFAGYSTLGAAALRIIEDYQPKVNKAGRVFEQARAHTRYPLPLMLEKVINRRESVATYSDNSPSYIWWTMGLTKYNELAPIPDLGKLPESVRQRDYAKSHRLRVSWPKSQMDNDGPWKLCLDDEVYSYDRGEGLGPQSELYLMMVYGVSFGQRILTRCSGETYRSSYECEEYDSTWDAEVIYAEAARAIDIPFDFPNFAQPAKFLRWSIA
jgi:hypothetical protein